MSNKLHNAIEKVLFPTKINNLINDISEGIREIVLDPTSKYHTIGAVGNILQSGDALADFF